jgi:hypothetical protein
MLIVNSSDDARAAVHHEVYKAMPLERDHQEIKLSKFQFITEKDFSTTEPKASLIEPPHFEALSHTWGEPVFPKAIQKNSHLIGAEFL